MQIDHLILGAFETNCYVLRADADSKDCIIVDTGLDASELVAFLAENSLRPVLVILTHGHADHMAGVIALRAEYPDIKVMMHKLDGEMLTSAGSNLSRMAGMELQTEAAEILVEEPYTVKEAGVELEVLHTPGHTPGGISLYSADAGVVFTGDALFADSVGRTDFPGGSMQQLVCGIRKKLMVLADETVVYPGHGPFTTIGRERKYNQYLQ